VRNTVSSSSGAYLVLVPCNIIYFAY
jgi:hypothetical protein